MTKLVVPALILLAGCSLTELRDEPISLDELKIQVFEGSREVGYTNKEAGFFYTETSAEHRSGWQGWHIMSKKFLDDYAILVDRRELKKSEVQLAMVWPHQLQRAYPPGVQETVTLLDSVNAVVVELRQIKGTSVTIHPLFSGSHDARDYLVRPSGDLLLIARRNHLVRTARDNYPVWLGITVLGGGIPEISTDQMQRNQAFSPAAVRQTVAEGAATAILVAGNTESETIALLRQCISELRPRIEARRRRMEQVLERTRVRTDDHRFDKAFHWSLLSMDALVMNQGRKGIFAGLPWFSNYWGRDSFISLAGATLVSGSFDEAREVLRSFADWQDRDPKSKTYGRIPNLVTPGSVTYNTTDGTSRFVGALGEYVNYTGDTAFARVLYPAVIRAIEGTLKYRVDQNILMTHEDAETWMDAVGPEGPWSPRGDRACDIQALWYRQLLVSSWLAGLMNDHRRFREWFSYAEQVQISFNRLFVDPERQLVADHLNRDGSADRQLRPNQIFALGLIDDPAVRFNVFKTVTESLVYVHGVASLSQEDENFHPYHHYAPYYVQDAAYHNGIVWTWLAGPWISVATRYGYADLAYRLTNEMTHQILDRGAVGTISELLDAAPREGEALPRLSGTFTQAWSLAEYLRTWYQDFLGVGVDAVEGKLELAPSLPEGISEAAFTVAIGNGSVRVRYNKGSSEATITLTSTLDRSLDVIVTWRLASGVEQNFSYPLGPNARARLSIGEEEVSVEDQGGPRIIEGGGRREFDATLSPLEINLAAPSVRENLRSLKGPDHRLLSLREIKPLRGAVTVMTDVTDPTADDRGPGSYVYPTSPALRPGSLDITRFTVAADEENTYFSLAFRNLSNPGWHPEYGFQLTFAAIAIDKDGREQSGKRMVGRNANVQLPGQYGYESIVFIGGGVRVEDAGGKVLAEYLPVSGDESNPLGSVSTRTIEFALPNDLIGNPQSSWRYFVYVGAQDDHGGAGLGDFREVAREAGEWTGGGKRNRNDPNIYDTLFIQ